MIRGLTDVSAVGQIPSLRALFLQALRRVETLPDFHRATDLRRVRLETMKGLRDLARLQQRPRSKRSSSSTCATCNPRISRRWWACRG